MQNPLEQCVFAELGNIFPSQIIFPCPRVAEGILLRPLQSLFVQRKGKQHLSLEPMPTPPKASKCHSNKEIRRW